MVKIAKDTPVELLNLGKRLQFSGTKDEVSAKVKQLKNIAVGYVPTRAGKPTYMDFNIDSKFQPLANLISLLDFSQVNQIKRSIGLTFIENYLQKQGFLK
jgi:hypothetical protein